ncbi:hypothetical protein ACFL27_27870 [candidate division CSSED10-310 bacterium]|uniref:Phosphatase n=1 Tax=candidate division CSSED10-310 bacterium TaxID=2855610 RepID=A0ABV6Z6E5_UNCC1
MIRNDLHVHSIQSSCGLHTLFEIVMIAHGKGMNLVNISDHGPGSGRFINLGVMSERSRLPDPVTIPGGPSLFVLRGIEANIMNRRGDSDLNDMHMRKLDLISAGFHTCSQLPAFGSEKVNTAALINFLQQYPLDILTHPCIRPFPLDIATVIDLSLTYGFALEVNNTSLRLDKTNRDILMEMIILARDKQALLVETSDGHTYHEIGENEAIESLLEDLSVNGDLLFLNRDDEKLKLFIQARRRDRLNYQSQ